MGINLNYISSTALTATYPIITVTLNIFNGQTNVLGTITPTYTQFTNISANVQLLNSQELKHIDGYNSTKVYKKFWLNAGQLTGLNRNLSTGGDYISWNGLVYKIIGVANNFLTGWVKVLTVESNVI